MNLKLPQKFKDLFDIYQGIKGSNRLEKYNISECIYQEKQGEYAFDDFRRFAALLNMHYASLTPHNSSVKGYVRRDQV